MWVRGRRTVGSFGDGNSIRHGDHGLREIGGPAESLENRRGVVNAVRLNTHHLFTKVTAESGHIIGRGEAIPSLADSTGVPNFTQ